MNKSNRTPGALVIEADGQVEIFKGYLMGAPVSEATVRSRKDFGFGEVVFNTSMTGYQEILTDPSYYGEIVCMTAAHIGNTGFNREDEEGARIRCAGFVIQDLTDEPSNWRNTGSLEEYLVAQGVPGICGVDTRAVTRFLRSRGVERGLILPESEIGRATDILRDLPRFEGRDLISEVTTRESYLWQSAQLKAPSQHKVVVMDFGVKWNQLRTLAELGCELEVVPASTTAAAILARKPDGVFLSNGPGDPSAVPYAAETVRGLVGQVPIFGVCMGHQILSLAMGAKTYKLKFGHRGGNQPVRDCSTGQVEISSHNHGYCVDEKTLPPELEVTHWNLNDHTVEGVRVKGQKAFSVQYHPEAAPGPHDSSYLFERFVSSMQN